MNDVINEYISQYPDEVQVALNQVATAIREEMPEFAVEKFAFQMPAFDVYGSCVYFAATKKHIGFYPTASGIANFIEEFEKRGLKYSKGAVQFPLNKPMPLDLVKVITRFRIEENIEKYELKKRK